MENRIYASTFALVNTGIQLQAGIIEQPVSKISSDVKRLEKNPNKPSETGKYNMDQRN
jgi:hypothetical protein